MVRRDTWARRLALAVLPTALAAGMAGDPAAAGGVPAAEAGGVHAAAKGNPKAYAFLSRSGDAKAPIARWNPCEPVRYRVNLDRAAKGALTDVQGALSRMSKATGLRFAYRGTTKVIPAAKKGYPATYPADTDLVIAWATPGKHSTMLPAVEGLAGMGGGSWTSARTGDGAAAYVFTQGRVVLNASMRLPAGFGQGDTTGWQGTRGQLLMHEIGHAVGLDHPKIKDAAEIMYPSMTRKAAAWGAGDLNGLRALGKSGGCLVTGNRTDVATAGGVAP